MNKFLSRRGNDNSDEGSSNGFRVSLNQQVRNIFTIYLFGDILDSGQFIDAMEAMSGCGPQDVVVLKICSGGGDLDATDSFVSAIRNCPAHVVAEVSGSCHSAASIIMLAADDVAVSEHASMLIHNGACGSGGKYSDWRAQAKHTEAYMERVLRSAYEGFFSEEDINAILAGKDFWLTQEEILDRLDARDAYFAAQDEEHPDDCSCDVCEASYAVGLTD